MRCISSAALSTTLLVTACGGGGSSTAPIQAPDVEPDFVFARSRRDSPHQFTEIRTSARSALGDARAVPDRTGIESHVRVHPDGNRIVFARQRTNGNPSSREIYTATLDGSEGEARLTANSGVDDSPCWSSDGSRIYFSADRGAGRRLWSITPSGSDEQLLFDDGTEQSDPDARDGRLIYTRWDPTQPSPRATLWTYDETSAVAAPLTDGGIANSPGEVPGDYEGAISPDGATLAFTRTLANGSRSLFTLDLASRSIEPVAVDADHRTPRWTPAGSTLLTARQAEAAGITGYRLYEMNPDGGDPLLVFPDVRFDVFSVDPLPSMPARAEFGDTLSPSFDDAAGRVAFGSGSIGSLSAIELADGIVTSVFTAVFNGRDVAGLEIEFILPVAEPEDVTRVDIAVRAGVSRTGPDSLVRVTLRNFIENRNDTILERQPADTSLEDYRFSIQSLAHVSRARRLTVTVIADLPVEDVAELFIDRVQVEFRTR